ncbi:MAG: hypothetical protein M5U34_34940 [Chloroflexi bacterium]|nr:hypothetical protein [Chloroflexota bacterium]
MIEFWRHEEQVPFKGWDFSYIRERMIEESPPWSYKALAMTLMAQADSLLDMGTGGGERLLSMREAWPPQVFATEGYAPNVALARKKLEPWGR